VAVGSDDEVATEGAAVAGDRRCQAVVLLDRDHLCVVPQADPGVGEHGLANARVDVRPRQHLARALARGSEAREAGDSREFRFVDADGGAAARSGAGAFEHRDLDADVRKGRVRSSGRRAKLRRRPPRDDHRELDRRLLSSIRADLQ